MSPLSSQQHPGFFSPLLRPSRSLALSFLFLIAVGTALLMLPIATHDGQGAAWRDALFTMTSAACISGLTTVSVGQHYTTFGQGVILLGMQAGALGIMVLSAMFAFLVGGRLPLRRQAQLEQMLDVGTSQGLRELVIGVTSIALAVEFLGAAALFAAWHDAFPHWSERAWWSLFHAVSAFCNAGFSLWDDSLRAWVDRPEVWGIFVVLIRLGSLGFFVLVDLAGSCTGPGGKGPRAVWHRLHTQTKVVLAGMLLLDVVGFALFWLLEHKGVLAVLPQGARAQAALFQSITLRSAGLQTIFLAELSAPAALLCSLWMFIGAAPGSTGGGVKITTVVIAVVAVRALLSEQGEVQLFGRRVAGALVNRSLVIVLLAGGVAASAVFMLCLTEDFPLHVLLFEAVSAGTTTGLSMGVTAQLTSVGRFVLIGMMFIGRIGPLTLALAVGEGEKQAAYRYPLTRIAVG